MLLRTARDSFYGGGKGWYSFKCCFVKIRHYLLLRLLLLRLLLLLLLLLWPLLLPSLSQHPRLHGLMSGCARRKVFRRNDETFGSISSCL